MTIAAREGEAGNEVGRKLAHVFFGLPSLLAVVLDWRVTLLVALYFLFLNVELLPRTRLGQGWRRPEEGALGGLVAYPLAVCLLAAIFRENTLAIAAGWAAMSFGDPAASWVGCKLGGPVMPWNRRKRLTGAVAFKLAATPALAAVFLLGGVPVTTAVALGALLALLGAVVETLPLPVDDNLVVALAVGFATAPMTALLGGV